MLRVLILLQQGEKFFALLGVIVIEIVIHDRYHPAAVIVITCIENLRFKKFIAKRPLLVGIYIGEEIAPERGVGRIEESRHHLMDANGETRGTIQIAQIVEPEVLPPVIGDGRESSAEVIQDRLPGSVVRAAAARAALMVWSAPRRSASIDMVVPLVSCACCSSE